MNEYGEVTPKQCPTCRTGIHTLHCGLSLFAFGEVPGRGSPSSPWREQQHVGLWERSAVDEGEAHPVGVTEQLLRAGCGLLVYCLALN